MTATTTNPNGLVVTRLVTRLNVGGPARQELALTGAMRRQGFDCELVAGSLDAGEGPAQGAGAVDRVIPTLGRQVHPARDIRALLAIGRHLRHRRPDVVHTHMAKAGALGRLAAFGCGVPVTAHTFHGHVLEGYFSSRTTDALVHLERALACHTDALVAVSAAVRDELLALGIGRPDQWHVIPLGLELAALHRTGSSKEQSRAELGLPTTGPVVAMVTRLVPVKDPDTFLRAARQVAEAIPEATFVVAGDGELRPALERQGGAMLGDRIRFLGWVHDVAPLYRASDVVLLSSRHEGTPAALIEAAAAGRPVVATDVGGVRDVVIEGVTGHLVRPADARSLALATQDVLRDPQRAEAMGAAGRRLSERFSTDRLAADLRVLYATLIDARPRPRAVRGAALRLHLGGGLH